MYLLRRVSKTSKIRRRGSMFMITLSDASVKLSKQFENN